MERQLRLRIVLEKPPAGVDFGLQQGKGSNYQTVQIQRSGGQDLTFDFSVGVKPGKGSTPAFTGPFAQGPPAERFVYLDIGSVAGQADTPWSRRLKIPLHGITWEVIESLAADPRSVLEARVPGTGRDGGPSCATVKPFDGWKRQTV
jgi:hypothetical protein